MTSLEKLIKLASTDGAAHYRELAKEAQKELEELRAIKRLYSEVEQALRDKLVELYGEKHLEQIVSACTPTNPVAK